MSYNLLYTAELQWLEQAGTMKISLSHSLFQPSIFYINLNSRDHSPIYETSLVRVFVLLLSFSMPSDCRSLK